MNTQALKLLQKPLEAHQIEFRVQQVSPKGWALLLAYKDARCDMARLDEAVGPMNWKREHIRDNKNCCISIWDESKSQWVSKEDTGTESNTEAQKGLASDSFKRAGFNWGIGRELYDYPDIWVKLNPNEFKVEGNKAKATWDLKVKEWIWFNQFDSDGNLNYLAAKDANGLRYDWGKFTKIEEQAA